MSDSRIQKAQDLVKQGDKKVAKWVYFGSKYEDAKDCYEKAANLFKICKQYQEAAEAYEKVATCLLKMGDSKYEIATTYVEMANVYKKCSKSDAIQALQKAIILFTEDGKFRNAAQYEQEIAEVSEELGNLDKSVEHYKLARDYFENDNAKSSAFKCSVALGHIEATRENYDDAIEAFESAGNMCVDDKLLAWSAKDSFFKAALCHFCKKESFDEIEDIKEVLESYCDTDIHFSDSSEFILLNGIAEGIEKKDIAAITDAIRDYDRVKKLDSWKTTILLRLKKAIQNSAANPSLV